MNPFGNPRKLMKQLQQAQEQLQREIAALRSRPPPAAAWSAW